MSGKRSHTLELEELSRFWSRGHQSYLDLFENIAHIRTSSVISYIFVDKIQTDSIKCLFIHPWSEIFTDPDLSKIQPTWVSGDFFQNCSMTDFLLAMSRFRESFGTLFWIVLVMFFLLFHLGDHSMSVYLEELQTRVFIDLGSILALILQFCLAAFVNLPI